VFSRQSWTGRSNRGSATGYIRHHSNASQFTLLKRNAVIFYGAQIVLYGQDYDEASLEYMRISHETKKVINHPYNDPWIIAGQGTVALELCQQWAEIDRDKFNRNICSNEIIFADAVFVGIGGGGLISGVSVYIKQKYPNTRIIGVECVSANAVTRSLASGQRERLNHVGSFADGAAAKTCGKETFRLSQLCVDEMINVTDEELCKRSGTFIKIREQLLKLLCNGICKLSKIHRVELSVYMQ